MEKKKKNNKNKILNTSLSSLALAVLENPNEGAKEIEIFATFHVCWAAHPQHCILHLPS